MASSFGGGRVKQIQISDNGRLQPATARVDIFGTDIGIVHDGPHRIAVPQWRNQLINDLLRAGRPPRYTPDTLVYQVVGDVFAGVRYTHRVLYGNYGVDFYSGMKGRLMKAIGVLDQMSLLALGFRKGTIDRHIGDFQRMIGEVFTLVGTDPTDLRKKKVITYGERIKCGRDSRGQVNPSAAMMQIIAGKKDLQSVVESIMSIEPSIIRRQQVLVSIVNYAEAVITGVRQFLDLLLMGDNFTKIEETGDEREKVLISLGFYRQELQTIDIAPYYRTCFAIRDEFRRAIEDIKEGKFVHARRLLSRSRESLKIRGVRLDIERMLMLVMLNETDPRAHPLALPELYTHLADCVRRLSAVDERGFALPVLKDAIPHLGIALGRLQSVRSATALQADKVFYVEIRKGIKLL